jgi:hypothetical protein
MVQGLGFISPQRWADGLGAQPLRHLQRLAICPGMRKLHSPLRTTPAPMQALRPALAQGGYLRDLHEKSTAIGYVPECHGLPLALD